MNRKIKFLLSFLAVVAGFLVIRIVVLVKEGITAKNRLPLSQIQAKNNDGKTSTERYLQQDSDGDGLPDREEIIYGTSPNKKDSDRDGFIDGEEIASGFNPLNKYDNAKNNPQPSSTYSKNVSLSANFTDRVTDLAFASLIDDSGQINLEGKSEGDFMDIVQRAKLEMASYFHVNTLQDSDIKIAEQENKESIQRYIDIVAPLIEKRVLTANADIAKSLSTYGLITPKDYQGYQTAYQTLLETEVPASWKELHKKTLTLLLSFADSFRALSGTTIEKDPVKAVAALNQIQSLSLQISVLLSEAGSLMTKAGIQSSDIVLNAYQ